MGGLGFESIVLMHALFCHVPIPASFSRPPAHKLVTLADVEDQVAEKWPPDCPPSAFAPRVRMMQQCG